MVKTCTVFLLLLFVVTEVFSACSTGEIDVGGVCQDCPAGQTSNAAHTLCVDCPPGTSSNTGSNCFTCSTGDVAPNPGTPSPCAECPPGTTHNSDHTACIDCPPGTSSGTSSSCFTCSTGDVAPNPGTPSPCSECPPGTTHNAAHTACIDCPPGTSSGTSSSCFTCSTGDVAPNPGTPSPCSQCPPGTTHNADHTACIDCPPGTSSGISSSCFTCGSGDIAPNPGTPSPCSQCPPGTTHNADHTACVDCPAGTYSNTGTVCFTCSTGDVAPNPGTSPCLRCPPGTTHNADHTVCIACPAGTFSGESSSCSTCGTGDVAPNEGSASCDRCPPGQTNNAARTECVLCPAGTSSSESSSCSACSNGRIAPFPGSLCYPCGPGTTSDAAHLECVPCAPGTFSGSGACSSCSFDDIQPNEGGGDCYDCPDGLQSNVDNSDCEVCADGRGGYRCGSCSSGRISISGSDCFSCPEGSTSTDDNQICVLCPPGSYSSSSGCNVCDPLRIQPNEGQSSCLTCPTGSVADRTRTSCVPCPAGFEPASNGCAKCGTGEYSEGGEDCKPCPDGFTHSLNHVSCIPCPPGTREFLGSCVVCGSTSVSAGSVTSCTTCTGGTVPDAKRINCIPSGNPIGCSYTQILVGGVCQNCPANMVANEAGDTCVFCGIGAAATSYGCEFCDDDEISDGTVPCSDCPGGLLPNNDHSACVECPPGQAEVESGVCYSCSIDRYAPGGTQSCPLCSTGFESNPTYTDCDLVTCTLPEVATILSGGLTICSDPSRKPCPDGQGPVNGVCTPCPINTYSTGTVGGGVCVFCPLGFDTRGTTGNTGCTKCDPGTSVEVTGASCSLCGIGLIQDGSTDVCMPCPSGTTASDGLNCTPCPIGYSTSGVGGNCVLCDANEFSPLPGGRCATCPPGTQGSADRTSCELCQPGTYRVTQSACLTCGTNSIAPELGSKFCTSCPSGTYANADRTECLECTCAICGSGPLGCTNPEAVNYNYKALVDSGSCEYSKSAFVSDVVSCPNEGFTSTSFDINFSSFGSSASQLTILGVDVGLIAYFDDGASATIDLIAPSGTRIRLISPGELDTTCLINILFTSNEGKVIDETADYCIGSEFEIPCVGFFGTIIYIEDLQNIFTENSQGQWKLELSGSGGEFVRAQFYYSEYYKFTSDYKLSDEEIDIINCSDLGGGFYEIEVTAAFGSTLVADNVISGSGCGSFVIKIDSIVTGTTYLVNGHATSLDNVFEVLELNSVVPENQFEDPEGKNKRITFDFTLVDTTIASGSVAINSVLSVSNEVKVKLGGRFKISISAIPIGIKEVAITIFGEIINKYTATLGWEIGEPVEELETFWDRTIGRGVFTVGPVPIPFEVLLGGVGGYSVEFESATTASASVTFTNRVELGVRYKRGAGLKPIAKQTSSVTNSVDFEQKCSLVVKAYCGPRLTFGLGKSDVLFLPVHFDILPYIGAALTQQSGEGGNKKCCNETSLEYREFWGIEGRISAGLEIAGDDDDDEGISIDFGDPITFANFERDLTTKCYPSIPLICPTVNCNDLDLEGADANGNTATGVPTVITQTPRTAGGFGDPHFRTIDDCSFNFQGSGEYLLLESKESDFDHPFVLQGRMQRKTASSSVSWLTAVSMTHNPAEAIINFGVKLNAGTDPYSLIINNDVVNLPLNCPYSFPGGTIKRTYASRFIIDYDRGYSISISSASNTLTVKIKLPLTAFGKNIGILGSYDDIKENQFTGRDDVLYGTCTTERGNNCVNVYSWAETYLISQSESLFYYKEGEDSASFYISPGTISPDCAAPNFPTPESEEIARAACSAVMSDPDLFNSCLWDILETNDFTDVNNANEVLINDLVADAVVSNLLLSIGTSNEVIISWEAPTPPPGLSDNTILYDIQYRILNSAVSSDEQSSWINLISSHPDTSYSFALNHLVSTAIGIRVRPNFVASEIPSTWTQAENCIPLCTDTNCCDNCNFRACLACPAPFTCFPPDLSCEIGFFDREVLFLQVDCQPCTENTYSEEITGDNGKCKSCPTGTNTNGLTGSTLLSACGCDAGSGNPSGSPDSPSCSECAENFYSPTWRDATGSCIACPGISTTDGNTASIACGCPIGAGTASVDPADCATCADGFISSSFTNPGIECTICSAGQTSNAGHDTCINCLAGQSSVAGGICINCPAGQSSIAGGLCQNCLAGQSSISGGLCGNCPAGQSSVAGGLCENCAAGRSSVSGGLCGDCPAGQSSVAGGLCENCDVGQSSISGGLCENCPAGQSSDAGASCINCIAGQSSVSGGVCEQCSVGFISTSGGLCTACPDGHSSNADNTVCDPCPAGQVANSGESCTLCPAGSSSPGGTDTCTPCLAGQSSVSGGTCTACPAGQSSVSGGLCTNCPAGQTSSSGGPCINCQDGEFSVSGGPCVACDDGSTSTSPHTTCIPCPGDICTCIAGQLAAGGVCTACPAGTSSEFPYDSCNNCPAGQSSVSGGLCENCPAGQTSVSGGLCENCPAGQISISGGSCTNCPENQSSTSGSDTCVNCPANQRSESGGLCEDCPAGQTSLSGQSCTNCPAGQSSISGGSCSNCPAGQSSVSGGLCENCAAGTSSVSGELCVACVAGQSSIAGGLCENCPGGQSSESGGFCEDCPLGHFSAAGELCQPCPAGSSSSAGSSDCTLCSAGTSSLGGDACAPCNAGQFSVEGGSCQNCPENSSSNGGDPSCFECGDGRFSVAGGLCEDCTAGTFSAQGITDGCEQCPAGQSSENGASEVSSKMKLYLFFLIIFLVYKLSCRFKL